MSISIRPAHKTDLPVIFETYAVARELMRQSGNPTQWGNNRPAPSTIEKDVQDGHSFVVVDEQDAICAVFTCINHWADPTYQSIEGAWLNDDDYAVIHRIASNGRVHGVLSEILKFGEQCNRNVRIDTHQDNHIMQHLLAKNGYTHCGTIITDDGTPRLAYMKSRMG